MAIGIIQSKPETFNLLSLDAAVWFLNNLNKSWPKLKDSPRPILVGEHGPNIMLPSVASQGGKVSFSSLYFCSASSELLNISDKSLLRVTVVCSQLCSSSLNFPNTFPTPPFNLLHMHRVIMGYRLVIINAKFKDTLGSQLVPFRLVPEIFLLMA